jgi:peptidoglycan/LPS O-acetylase OafA/YrhL
LNVEPSPAIGRSQPESGARHGASRHVLEHMPQLDGLRALAVIAVVAQHAVPGAKAAFPWAHAGVRLFFVLSGFLITGILLESRDRSSSPERTRWRALRDFYIRRCLRIFPLYFFVIALGLTFRVGPIDDAFWWLVTYSTNIYLALRNQWVDAYSHFWTLAIGEQFYLVWPWIVLVAPRRWLVPSIAIMGAIALTYRALAAFCHFSVISTYCLTPACIDSLAVGALIAVMNRSRSNDSARIHRLLERGLIILGVAGIIAVRFLGRWNFAVADVIFFDLTLAVFFAGLVKAAARGIAGPLGALLSSAPLRFIGKISYGIYVYHVFLPALLSALVNEYALRGIVDESQWPGTRISPWLSLLMVPVPVLSWYLMEQPINRLKEFLGREPAPRQSGAGRAWRLSPLFAYLGVLVLLLSGVGYRAFQGAMIRKELSGLAMTAKAATGRCYYVSPKGDDSALGTSPSSAWRSIDRVNRAAFAAGDQILFLAGAEFPGNLKLGPDDRGVPGCPIVVATYGSGRAKIIAAEGDGIAVRNTMGLRLKCLQIVGPGATTHRGNGIAIVNNLEGDVLLQDVQIEGVQVSGFGGHGVLVDGDAGKSGFGDLMIRDVEAHDNGLSGITVRGEHQPLTKGYAHRRVMIDHCLAHHNAGIPGVNNQHSGSGIVVSDVSEGTIQFCQAFENGQRCEAEQGGPVGIWVWDSQRITIQFNESHHNRVNGPKDGGGFDLDGGVTDSIVQYNRSDHNAGAGYLLARFPGARPFRRNVVRYNLSWDDARRNGYAGITFWGQSLHEIEVYNNTVITSPAPHGTPRAIDFVPNETQTWAVHVRNNLLQVRGGIPVVEVPEGQHGLVFQGNNYHSSGQPMQIRWKGKTYGELASWREEAGQERVQGRDVGLSLDPKLQVSALSTRLRGDSPLIDAGLDLRSLFGVEPGTRDLDGTPLPQGSGYDIGAIEYLSVQRVFGANHMAPMPGDTPTVASEGRFQ